MIGIPVMFTLVVAILLNPIIPPEIRIAQAGLIVALTGAFLYGTVTYFLRKLHKEIEIAKMGADR
jgi:hypothetical protein